MLFSLVKVVKGITESLLNSAMYIVRKKGYRPFLMTHEDDKLNLV